MNAAPEKLIIALRDDGTSEMLVITEHLKLTIFKPGMDFLIIIKVYCGAFIHEASAEAMLG